VTGSVAGLGRRILQQMRQIRCLQICCLSAWRRQPHVADTHASQQARVADGCGCRWSRQVVVWQRRVGTSGDPRKRRRRGTRRVGAGSQMRKKRMWSIVATVDQAGGTFECTYVYAGDRISITLLVQECGVPSKMRPHVVHIDTCMHGYKNPHRCMHACIHTYMHACTRANMLVRTHTYKRAYACMHVCTHTHTHTQAMHAHTHTDILLVQHPIFPCTSSKGKARLLLLVQSNICHAWEVSLYVHGRVARNSDLLT
jgi:hypothetical protein